MKIENNPKYQQLISTGRALFWKYGFKKVSIQEICKEAGLSKMTYYRFFQNKIELAKAVFDLEVEKGVTTFRNILQEKISPPEKIKKIIAMKQEGLNGVSKEFIQDFYGSDDPELKTFIQEKTSTSWNEMLADIKKAQKKGIFRKDMKPEFLFFFAQKASELLHDPQLSKFYDSPQDLLLELSKFLAYGISPHD